MSTPVRIYDSGTEGSPLTAIAQDGPGWFTLPFADRGDSQSFEWHAYFTQLASSYVAYTNSKIFSFSFAGTFEAMPSIATSRGTAFLVHEDEATEVNNTGLLRFKRTYASIPATRIEPTSCIYSRQFVTTHADYTWVTPPALPEVSEIPIPLNGFRRFEYFNAYLPEQLYCGRVAVIFGTVLTIGTWPPDYTQPFVAEDSKRYIYKAGIICRETLFAQWPTTSA